MTDPLRNDSLLQRVRTIPGEDGFYKRHASKAYGTAAATLRRLGMSDDEIVEFLSGLYSATAEEFGS